MPLLLALHLAANAAALALGYYWLGVAEASAGLLAWSALLAALLLVVTCCSHGAALAYFETDGRRPADAWRLAVGHLPALAALAIVLAVVYWALAQWQEYSAKSALQIASWLTLQTRKAIAPASVQRVFDAALWVVRWGIVPALAVPFAAALAARGWKGRGTARRRGWLYWLVAPVLMWCTFGAPLALLRWVPSAPGFGMEAVSFTLRATAAYLLTGAGWLGLAFVTSRGKPRRSQSNTAVSP